MPKPSKPSDDKQPKSKKAESTNLFKDIKATAKNIVKKLPKITSSSTKGGSSSLTPDSSPTGKDPLDDYKIMF